MTQDLSGRNIGIFRLDRQLSIGGTAAVYEATIVDREIHPHRQGKKVALKIMHADHPQSALFEGWLKAEIDLLSKLYHPGIVRVYPIGQHFDEQYLGRAAELNAENPPWYFIMELLTHQTLWNLVYDQGGRGRNRGGIHGVDMHWRMELLYQVVIALDYLHLQRLAHRDLKPENILFRDVPRPGNLPRPVLIDFGLGAKREVRTGGADANALTPSHASPERIADILDDGAYRSTSAGFDHMASDIFSLGVIAYELFNGRYMFSEVTQETPDEELVQFILNRHAEPMNDDVPSDLQTLVFNMLEHNPNERPSTQQIIKWLETRGQLLPPRF